MNRLFPTFHFCLISFSQTHDENSAITPAPDSGKTDARIARFLKDNYFFDIPAAENYINALKGSIRFSLVYYTCANPEGYPISVQRTDISSEYYSINQI